MTELEIACTQPHCGCSLELHGASPLPFISEGKAVCSCHSQLIALAVGVEQFVGDECRIPQQRKAMD